MTEHLPLQRRMALLRIKSHPDWQNLSESLKSAACIFAKARIRYFDTVKIAWEAEQHVKNVEAFLSNFSPPLPFGICRYIHTICGANAYRHSAERHFEKAKCERENALQCLLELEENLETTVRRVCESRSVIRMRRRARGFCTDTSPMQSLRACIAEAEMALKNRDAASKQSVTVYYSRIPLKPVDDVESDFVVVGEAASEVMGSSATGKRRRSEVDVAGEAAGDEDADADADATGADVMPTAGKSDKRRRLNPVVSGNVASRLR